jgi:hypothetical protein
MPNSFQIGLPLIKHQDFKINPLNEASILQIILNETAISDLLIKTSVLSRQYIFVPNSIKKDFEANQLTLKL